MEFLPGECNCRSKLFVEQHIIRNDDGARPWAVDNISLLVSVKPYEDATNTAFCLFPIGIIRGCPFADYDWTAEDPIVTDAGLGTKE